MIKRSPEIAPVLNSFHYTRDCAEYHVMIGTLAVDALRLVHREGRPVFLVPNATAHLSVDSLSIVLVVFCREHFCAHPTRR